MRKKNIFLFLCEYFEEEENNNDNQLEVKNNIIKFEDLIEFRGRAMLAKKLGEDKMKEEKEIFELNQFFSERVNEISKINLILQKIAKRGYSENIMIEIIITDLKTVYSFERKIQFKDYQDCIQFLNEILKKTTETQLHFYKQNEFIRYIYGRQFNLLYSYLKRKGQKSIEPFLKYLSNDKIYYNLNENNYIYINSLDENDKYKCLLENCSLFISSLLQEKNISLEMILEQNQILPEYRNEFRGLYTYLKEDDKIGEVQKGIEEQILNWYHFLTGNSPMAQSLLLCNEETTLEEITSFLYRAFLCQYQVFFVVAKIELLTPENRQQLTDLINSLYIGHEKEMKSCLAFAYSDKTSTIVEYLETIKDHKILRHKKKRNNEEILYDEKVEIIYSDKSGVGKSTFIKRKIEENNKEYIHFPFGGVFNRKQVIDRLKKININNEYVLNVSNYMKILNNIERFFMI